MLSNVKSLGEMTCWHSYEALNVNVAPLGLLCFFPVFISIALQSIENIPPLADLGALTKAYFLPLAM